MSFSNQSNKDAFKKYLNQINNQKYTCKSGQPTNAHSNSPCKGSCSGKCDCDDDCECKYCACNKKDKSPAKPNSQTVRDDGCHCRKCNSFLPMVPPDDKGDGKTLCYNCANPW